MAKKQRSLNAKQRELNNSWEKLKRDQSKPLLDTRKYGSTKVSKPKPERAVDGLKKFANVNRERVITVSRPNPVVGLVYNNAEGIHLMEREEYVRREKAAREVKHCVMPLHKGAYILVTDEEMVKQMGKKTA